MSLFSKERTISIAPQSIIFTVFLLLSLYFIYYIKDVLLLVTMAFIIMVGLRPLAQWFEKHLHLKRNLAIILTYFIFVSSLILFLAFILPPVVKEIVQLFAIVQVPAIESQLRSLNFTLQEYSEIANRVGQSFGVVMQIINTTFTGVFALLTMFVISVYLMHERPNLHKKIGWFTDKKEHFEKVEAFLDSIEVQLGGWVRGQLILMFVVGLFTYIGLTLLGIPHALPLALIAGLLEIIPNIGPTLSSIPAIIIGFIFFGPIMAAVVLLLYIVVQQLENNLFVPKIMSVNANVNPLIAILAIIIGLKVAGVAGALLAIPLYIIMRTSYVHFFSLVDRRSIEAAKKA